MKAKWIRAALLAGITAVAVAGCSTPAEPEPTPEPLPVEPATQVEEEEPEPEGPLRSDRGHAIKQVGEPGYIADYSTGEDILTFVVKDLVMDPECTGEFAEAPENGTLIRIDMDVAATPQFDDMFIIGAGVWKWVDANGTTANVDLSTYAAWSCLPDAERLPPDVRQGERVTGSLVVDVPTREGTLILPLYGGTGWEWAVPAE